MENELELLLIHYVCDRLLVSMFFSVSEVLVY